MVEYERNSLDPAHLFGHVQHPQIAANWMFKHLLAVSVRVGRIGNTRFSQGFCSTADLSHFPRQTSELEDQKSLFKKVLVEKQKMSGL